MVQGDEGFLTPRNTDCKVRCVEVCFLISHLGAAITRSVFITVVLL